MGIHLKQLLPPAVRRFLRAQTLRAQRSMLPLDRVIDFSDLRSLRPYRPAFGWHRGKCVDRYYVEQFLATNSSDIRGRAVEIGENVYTAQFGRERVSKSEVLDIVDRPGVTIRADLTCASEIPDNSFDCFICTQTLPYVYDLRGAVNTIFRTLTPGGVALVTLPGISQIAPKRMTGGAEDYWRFTKPSAEKLFGDLFGAEHVRVETFGNVLIATALLHGLVLEELQPHEIAHNDPDYPVIVTVRAEKAACKECGPNA